MISKAARTRTFFLRRDSPRSVTEKAQGMEEGERAANSRKPEKTEHPFRSRESISEVWHTGAAEETRDFRKSSFRLSRREYTETLL